MGEEQFSNERLWYSGSNKCLLWALIILVEDKCYIIKFP